MARPQAPKANLFTRAPFHLEATVRVLQRRPANRVEVWEQGRYLRVLPLADGPALVEVRNLGTVDRPALRYSIVSATQMTPTQAGRSAVSIESTLRRVLGLDVDPEPLQRVTEAEPAFRLAAPALRGMRPPRFAGLFEAFGNVIPFQQVSLDAGVAIVGRLVERLGLSLEHDGRRFYAFPSAAAFADAPIETLREAGLSARKAEALRGLARSIVSGELREETLAQMSTPDALEALTALPGIGPWSASLVLLRGFGRIDVFPPGDVGAARGLRDAMKLGSDHPLEGIVERFGQYRGYLYFCVLGGKLLAKGLIQPADAERRA